MTTSSLPRVKISETPQSESIVSCMKQYFGTIQTIDRIKYFYEKPYAEIAGWLWEFSDLTVLDQQPYITQIVYFNPTELVGV